MSKIEKILHLSFWAISFIAWIFWVRERIQIFEYFVGNYKNIGYLINTNEPNILWYIIISAPKLLFILSLVYWVLPTFSYTIFAVYRAPLLMVGAMLIELLAAFLYFKWLTAQVEEGFRLDWNLSIFSITGFYIFYGVVALIISAAIDWAKEFQNLKKLYATQGAYTVLRHQLDPHFIFNSINSIYEIAVQDENEKIQGGILNLTKTLRYTFNAFDKDAVALATEVAAIQDFIELQKLRIDLENLQLSISFEVNHPQIKITPLLLLNFVENAFKHGYRYGQPSVIDIQLDTKNDGVNLEINNTNYAKRKNEEGGNQKVAKILDLKYAGKYKMDVAEDEEFYKLKLWIQLK